MGFRSFGPRITAEILASVERRLDVRFPHDYRAFLMTRNGGQLDDMYVAGPSELDVGVEEFLSVGPVAGGSDLVAATEHWRSLARGTGWPESLVVIAECAGGTLLLIDPHDGQIYRWDDRDPDQFAAVAASFEELLRTSVRAPEENPTGVESIWIDRR
ncbi:MAG TPA: SMI1/KNR4 family protein [Acidimicrobiia bacterium]|nr:SMI1/KNR4 family protein [Acidimicrobiia bacterium]